MKLLLLWFIFSFLFLSCGNNTENSLEDQQSHDSEPIAITDNDTIQLADFFHESVLNPSDNAPLTASIIFDAPEKGILEMTISGIDDTTPDYTTNFTIKNVKQHTIPVIGLFANHTNYITFTFTGTKNNIYDSYTIQIKTDPLPKNFPTSSVEGTHNKKLFTFVTWLATSMDYFFIRGIMFDHVGNVRWYSSFPALKMFPMEIIDGTIYGSDQAGTLFQYDFMGYEVNQWDLKKYNFLNLHHDIFKKDDGNLILTSDLINGDYIEDHIIEIDPADNTLINTWDLKNAFPDIADLFLDIPQTNMIYRDEGNDPVHVNGVWHNPDDNTIVVSSQRSGIASIDYNGRMKWFLTPHLIGKIDDKNGDGISDSFLEDYNESDPLSWLGNYKGDSYTEQRMPCNGKPADNKYPFDFTYEELLLKPLDKDGNEITETEYLNGFTDHPNFRWPFRPHSPKILKNGNIILFDNGLGRNFPYIPINTDSFSRLVEYKISPDTDGYGGTVEQIWEFIPADEPKWHALSIIVSDIDELENGNRLGTFGSVGSLFLLNRFEAQYGDGLIGALIIEVDPATNEEIHRLTLNRFLSEAIPPTAFSAYRSERVDPYKNFSIRE